MTKIKSLADLKKKKEDLQSKIALRKKATLLRDVYW